MALRDSENHRPTAFAAVSAIHSARARPSARSAMPTQTHVVIAKYDPAAFTSTMCAAL
jgi:hypothetical protein